VSIRDVANKSGTTVLAFVSRRAAGIWTNLPSLTYSLLNLLPPPNSAIWIDFGLRYEMFNHFRIDAHTFSPNCTLLQLMAMKTEGKIIPIKDIITYDQVVSSTILHLSGKTISQIQGDNVKDYLNTVSCQAKIGHRIYMIPWYTPLVSETLLLNDVDLNLLDGILSDILEQLRPQFLFMTWEGQPEVRLFKPKLQEDVLLRWGLNEAHRIISLVRFDSEERFYDSVSVPALIVEELPYLEKLRIVLTRATQRPRSDVAAFNNVIGQLPFVAFVGQSVNTGRIPIIDMWCQKDRTKMSSGEVEYFDAIIRLAKNLLEDK
jgi:hypothetical protein